MRTTITVDGELAERIKRLSRERDTSFEALATAALREGLEHLAEEASRKEPGRISYTRPVSLGGCLLDNLDDVSGALAAAEESSARPTLKELLLAETPRAEIPVSPRRRW